MFHFCSLHVLLFWSACLSLAGAQQGVREGFNPHSYQKQFVTCPAVERSGGSTRNIQLKLAYLDINPSAKKTLILVHGWPSLWTTYRHQITYFQKTYRLIVPEHRGYGDSEHPQDLNASNTIYDFVNDIQCMMNNANVKSGVCVGNDFGAQVCWEAGRSRPDRFIGVFNVGIPYISAELGFSPNEALAKLNPSFSYQVYLGSNPVAAAKEMNDDPRSSIRSCAQIANSTLPKDFLKRNDTFLGPWKEFLKTKNLKDIPFSGIMTPVVEDYMVQSYRKQGFYNTYNGYQYGNRKLTFDFEKSQGNYTLSQPTFTLFPTKDPVSDWEALAQQVKSTSFLRNHLNATIPTAHWPQEELPDHFNLILSQWLGNITFYNKS